MISVSTTPSPLLDSLFFTFPGLLFCHLPPSCRGNQGSLLSLKLLSSYLNLFGILSATSIVLSSNFMTPIYDFKFYDWNLCLQYPSLRLLPSGVYIPTGQHTPDSNGHLAINMSNDKHMTSPVPSSRQRIYSSPPYLNLRLPPFPSQLHNLEIKPSETPSFLSTPMGNWL